MRCERVSFSFQGKTTSRQRWRGCEAIRLFSGVGRGKVCFSSGWGTRYFVSCQAERDGPFPSAQLAMPRGGIGWCRPYVPGRRNDRHKKGGCRKSIRTSGFSKKFNTL